MVKLNTASSPSNTSTIVFEEIIFRFNSNWDWSIGEYTLKSGRIVLLNIVDSSDISCYTVWIIIALTLSAIVRVSFLDLMAIVMNKAESSIIQTTLATMITIIIWAIKEFLFWETYELACPQCMVRLDSSFGWKCPAGSTLALIFHSIDYTLLSPINGTIAGGTVRWNIGDADIFMARSFNITEKFLVLSRRPVRHMV